MKRLLAVVLALSGVMAPRAQDIGEVVFVEGYPEVVRDGELLFETLDFGFPVQNFDAFRTDGTSTLEISLDPDTGIDATIFVGPDTRFYLTSTASGTRKTGTVALLAGSVSLIAREVRGDSRLHVRTQSAVAGVRGTAFSVTTSIGGEILVLADEGIVEVTAQGAPALFAAPGEAVEIDAERNAFRNLKYAMGAPEFRRQWLDERGAAFRDNMQRILRFHALTYLVERDHFDQSYRNLMSHRATVDRWIVESRRGAVGDNESIAADSDEIRDALAAVRDSAHAFEFTLTRLERMMISVEGTAPDVDLGRGNTAADVLRRLDLERDVMTQRLSTVRHVLRLYSLRNDGRTPEPPQTATP